MPEWLKVILGCAALMIGAATPSLILIAAHPIWLSGPSQSEMRHQGSGESTAARHSQGQQEETQAQPDPPSINVRSPKADRDVGANSEENGEWYQKPDWWVAIFTFLLFVATGGLWIFTAFLWYTTRRAVIDGEKALVVAQFSANAARDGSIAARDSADAYRRSERAWIGLVRIESAAISGRMNEIPVSHGFRFTFVIGNTGRTPAINADCFADHRILPTSDNNLPNFMRRERDVGEFQSIANIVPGVTFSPMPRHINDADSRALLQRTKKAILYGHIQYHDIMFPDETRITEFCIEAKYDGNMSGPGGKQVERFSYTPVGNQNTST